METPKKISEKTKMYMRKAYIYYVKLLKSCVWRRLDKQKFGQSAALVDLADCDGRSQRAYLYLQFVTGQMED